MIATSRCRAWRVGLWATAIAWSVSPASSQERLQGDARVSNLKPDERIVFFPSAARRVEDEPVWEMQLHAWVFEPSEDSVRRRALIKLLTSTMDDARDDAERARFETILRPFLVDNERGKEIVVRVGDRSWRLPPTGANGHAMGTLRLPNELVERAARDGRLTLQAVLPAKDGRPFHGVVHLIDPEGISVISDIDDTIKDSHVLDKRELLRNTFLRPFKPVEGMADVFGQWHSQREARFHFVSASPWQLFEPLEEMRRAAGFPPATFHLRHARVKDESGLQLIGDSQASKLAAVESILATFPRRSFLLIGDTGEKDPEVYGEIARRHPMQIVKIYLRNVTAESRETPRYEVALHNVPTSLWELFTDPKELKWPMPQ